MHPQTRSDRHPARSTALKLVTGVLALIGLGVVVYLLVVGAVVIGLVALAILGAAALLSRLVRRRT